VDEQGEMEEGGHLGVKHGLLQPYLGILLLPKEEAVGVRTTVGRSSSEF
jgi:hypothetical protein